MLLPDMSDGAMETGPRNTRHERTLQHDKQGIYTLLSRSWEFRIPHSALRIRSQDSLDHATPRPDYTDGRRLLKRLAGNSAFRIPHSAFVPRTALTTRRHDRTTRMVGGCSND